MSQPRPDIGGDSGDAVGSTLAAMQLVAEANNAVSSGVAGAGEWPPKVVWWGTQAFKADVNEVGGHSGTTASLESGTAQRGSEGSLHGAGGHSSRKRQTGLQRSGRQSLVQNSAGTRAVGSVEALRHTAELGRKSQPQQQQQPQPASSSNDRLNAGIDALLTRRPPQLPNGPDSIYDQLRDERQQLRLMESTGRGATMSFPSAAGLAQSQPLSSQHSNEALTDKHSENQLSRSASQRSLGPATVEDRLVQEAFAYAARLGATGARNAPAAHNGGLTRRGSGRRQSGAHRKNSSPAVGSDAGRTKRTNSGSSRRGGNQRLSGASKAFDQSPLAQQRRNRPRRKKAEFQLRDLRPEPAQNLDTLLEHLQSGNPARKLRMQLSKSKQSLSESEAFIQLAKESWFE